MTFLRHLRGLLLLGYLTPAEFESAYWTSTLEQMSSLNLS
jgi:hypothetical protein